MADDIAINRAQRTTLISPQHTEPRNEIRDAPRDGTKNKATQASQEGSVYAALLGGGRSTTKTFVSSRSVVPASGKVVQQDVFSETQTLKFALHLSHQAIADLLALVGTVQNEDTAEEQVQSPPPLTQGLTNEADVSVSNVLVATNFESFAKVQYAQDKAAEFVDRKTSSINLKNEIEIRSAGNTPHTVVIRGELTAASTNTLVYDPENGRPLSTGEVTFAGGSTISVAASTLASINGAASASIGSAAKTYRDVDRIAFTVLGFSTIEQHSDGSHTIRQAIGIQISTTTTGEVPNPRFEAEDLVKLEEVDRKLAKLESYRNSAANTERYLDSNARSWQGGRQRNLVAAESTAERVAFGNAAAIDNNATAERVAFGNAAAIDNDSIVLVNISTKAIILTTIRARDLASIEGLGLGFNAQSLLLFLRLFSHDDLAFGINNILFAQANTQAALLTVLDVRNRICNECNVESAQQYSRLLSQEF